jgi:hypothetical protein
MNRVAFNIAFVLPLLVCTLHAAPLQQRDAAKPSKHKQQTTSPQNNPQPPVAAEEGKEPNVRPQSSPAKQESSVPKKDDPDYTLWALIINGVLTVITLGIAITGILQALAAKESTDIATNSQRSWIVEDGIDDPDLTGVWIARATCHFKVFGSSPVRVTEAKFRFHLVNSRSSPKHHSKEPDLPEIPNYATPDTLLDNPQMGKVRPPDESFSVVPMLEGLFFKDGDIDAIKKGDKFLCIYGFIRYRDAFSKSNERETRFCYVYGERNPLDQRKGEFVIGGPPAYNEVT